MQCKQLVYNATARCGNKAFKDGLCGTHQPAAAKPWSRTPNKTHIRIVRHEMLRRMLQVEVDVNLDRLDMPKFLKHIERHLDKYRQYYFN